MRQAGRRHLGEQLARARLDRDAAAANLLGDAGHQPLADHVRRHRLGRPAEHVTHRAIQAAADQLRLVRLGPLRAEPGHDGRLDLKPQGLGVDEQPVHIE